MGMRGRNRRIVGNLQSLIKRLSTAKPSYENQNENKREKKRKKLALCADPREHAKKENTQDA